MLSRGLILLCGLRTVAGYHSAKTLRSNPIVTGAITKTMGQSQSNTKRFQSGHGYGGPQLSPEDEIIVNKFKEIQAAAPRLTVAEEIRTLIQQSTGYGVLSTNSVQFPGYPTGSVVGFWLDEGGMPFFSFSTMSAHTTDIVKDGKMSLTVMANDFKGAAEGRVVLIGSVEKVTDAAETARLKDLYLAKHKDAFWVTFGDFSVFRMTQLINVRYVGGFARAGACSGDEYKGASPDPLAPFAVPVITHMNDDHSDSLVAMVKHYAGVPCSEAKISSIDRHGMTVNAKLEIAGGGMSKVRLTFPSPVTERKAVKDAIVEMTRASMA